MVHSTVAIANALPVELTKVEFTTRAVVIYVVENESGSKKTAKHKNDLNEL